MVTGCSVYVTSCGGQRWLISVCLDCSFLFPSVTVAAAGSLLLFWTSFSLFQKWRKKKLLSNAKMMCPPYLTSSPFFSSLHSHSHSHSHSHGSCSSFSRMNICLFITNCFILSVSFSFVSVVVSDSSLTYLPTQLSTFLKLQRKILEDKCVWLCPSLQLHPLVLFKLFHI